MRPTKKQPNHSGWELTLRVFSSRSLVLALGGGLALGAEHCGAELLPLAQQAIELHGAGDTEDPDDTVADFVATGGE